MYSSHIRWENVNISLVDERKLSNGHPQRNDTMIAKTLIRNKVGKIKLINIFDQHYLRNLNDKSLEKHIFPIDILLLGMGLDGHTASLIPRFINLKDALDIKSNKAIFETYNLNKTIRRLTIGLRPLIYAEKKILFIKGKEKLAVLNASLQDKNFNMPISYFMREKLHIYWCK